MCEANRAILDERPSGRLSMIDLSVVGTRFLRCPRRWNASPSVRCHGSLVVDRRDQTLACQRCGVVYVIAPWGPHLVDRSREDPFGFVDEERRDQYRQIQFAPWLDRTGSGDRIAEAFGVSPRSVDFYSEVSSVLSGLSLDAAQLAVDVGCAVGRTTFELSRMVCSTGVALGVDTNTAHLQFASSLLGVKNGIQGVADSSLATALRREFGAGLNRTLFATMDASELALDAESVDVLLALNLLDRVRSPKEVLAEFARGPLTGRRNDPCLSIRLAA